MKKRPEVLTSLLVIGALIVMLTPIGITLFYFPTYRGLGQAISFLLIGGVTFYAGILPLHIAKRRGEPPLLPWWKQYLIIIALFWVCAGVPECLTWLPTMSKLFHDDLNSPLWSSIIVLFILPTIGFGIYGISLIPGQVTTSKRL